MYGPFLSLIKKYQLLRKGNNITVNILLITFANSLDPDQAQQNVTPDLRPN